MIINDNFNKSKTKLEQKQLKKFYRNLVININKISSFTNISINYIKIYNKNREKMNS
jgi:hypothetical protein